MQNKFDQFISKNNLCTRKQKVFVAVSGGIDSVVLLELFVSGGYNVTAVHVNFGLRGIESDEDEAFVRRKCEHLGVPFESRQVSTKNYATGQGVSVQMAARDLRYQWFLELVRSEPGAVVATAHHINDSGETMLLNFIRGTGIDGLTGIPVETNHIIRPLAFATRADISDYAAQHSITWREDASNQDDHYQRNFLRNRVMGLLKKINPSLDDTLDRNSTRMKGERELVEKSVSDWKEDFVEQEGTTVRILKDGLRGFIHKSGVLLRMIESFGFNFQTAESIVAAMEGQPGKRFFSSDYQLVIDREHLVITPFTGVPGDKIISDRDLGVERGSQRITIERSNNTTIDKRGTIATLDASKIQFPLTWRSWKEGDHFQPLGMKGTKKISDFLIDGKISLGEKDSVSVITSNEEIVWVVGMRMSDSFKVTSSTKDVLRLVLAP